MKFELPQAAQAPMAYRYATLKVAGSGLQHSPGASAAQSTLVVPPLACYASLALGDPTKGELRCK